MRSALDAYVAKLDELRKLLTATEHVDVLASAVADSGTLDRRGERLDGRCAELIALSTQRRRFVYAAAVVLLYGGFEAFAEELAMAYVATLDGLCPTFGDLPKEIRVGHVNASATLLLNRDVDKYRDRCDVEEVVKRLARPNAAAGERRVNELAFIDHRSNFRMESLSEFFKAAGIPGLGPPLMRVAELREFLEQTEGIEGIENKSPSVVFKDLDDLAQRRNEVAHGYPVNILSVESMLSRIKFMEALGKGILAVAEAELLKYQLKHGSEPLPKPLAVYRNAIACFALSNQAIERGCGIISRSPAGCLQRCQVLRIEVDGVAVGRVSAPPNLNVGLELDRHVNVSYDFFLMR